MGIIPQDALERVHAVVVGCGAIGSHLVDFLARKGVNRFTLIDHDIVGPENIVLQGFSVTDIGQHKVKALELRAAKANPDSEASIYFDRFDKDMIPTLTTRHDVIVFSCVDDIEVREAIWKGARDRCEVFMDGRMAALTWRVITVTDPIMDDYYERTLFKKADAYPVKCTEKGTVDTAAAPALQMSNNLTLWLKNCSVEAGNILRDIEGNILASTVGPREAP